MATVQVLILRAAGTNCDFETQAAWEAAGASAERIHIRRLIEQPQLLDKFQILTIPGGFSYGDDIAAGQIFANQLERNLIGRLRDFVDKGKLALGICNGFQVLAKAGLLPFTQPSGKRPCTITYNEVPGYIDRWVWLQANEGECAFLEPGKKYEIPIAHGEGRVVFANDDLLQQAIGDKHDALRYVAPPDGPHPAGLPYNPNGSQADIAGLCDKTGRVLGLMPHPERFVTWTQHPAWTSQPPREPGDGLAMFQRAVEYLS